MSSKHGRFSTAEIIAVAGGSLSALLGIVIITCWVLHLVSLLQIDPSYTPMVFNTALSFLLCGIAIATFGLRIKIVPLICGGFVSFLALLTLIQYIFNLDFGIDRLVIDPYITTKNPFPGRMAPNTTGGFLFIGLALLLLYSSARQKFSQLAISLVGSSAAALGVVVLIGYVVSFEAIYGWGDFSRMAPTTAIGFVICGISLFCYSIDGEKKKSGFLPRWLPVPVGMAVATAALILWHATHSTEIRQLKHLLQIEAESINYSMNQELENLSSGLIRMAKRWDSRGGMTIAEWTRDANIYGFRRDGFRALFLLDTTFYIVAAVPEERQNFNVGTVSYGTILLHQVLAATFYAETAVLTPMANLPLGGNGFLLTIPLLSDNQLKGMIQGKYEISAFALPATKNNKNVYCRIEMSDGLNETSGTETSFDGDHPYDSAMVVSYPFGTIMQVTVWPKPELIAQAKSLVPEVSLFAGLLTAILISISIGLFQTAQLRAGEFAELNHSLERKVQERTKEIKEHDEFTRNWLNKCTDGNFDWNLIDDTVVMSVQFGELLGYKLGEIDEKADSWRKIIFPLDLSVTEKALKEHLERDKPYAFQLRFVHKNGTIISTFVRGEGIKDDSGKSVRIVGTITDISKQKKMEEETLARAEELEQRNSELERFNRMAVGREKRMIELKTKINALCREMGKPEPYKLEFVSVQGSTAKVVVK